jgi:hypothetical protein
MPPFIGPRPRLDNQQNELTPFFHSDRTTVHAVISSAPGQVGDAGTGDHGLGRRAAHVDARAADVGPLDDRGPATGGTQVQGQRFSRLAGAQDDRVKTLHENASTTKEKNAVATLSACGIRCYFMK